MLKCKVCGTANSPDSSVCANCGEKLRENRKSSTGRRKPYHKRRSKRPVAAHTEVEDIFSTSDFEANGGNSNAAIKDIFSSEEAYEKAKKGIVLQKVKSLEKAIGDVDEVIVDEGEKTIVPKVINRSSSADIVRASEKFGESSNEQKGKKTKVIPHRVIRSVVIPQNVKKIISKGETSASAGMIVSFEVDNTSASSRPISDTKRYSIKKSDDVESEPIENDTSESFTVSQPNRPSLKSDTDLEDVDHPVKKKKKPRPPVEAVGESGTVDQPIKKKKPRPPVEAVSESGTADQPVKKKKKPRPPVEAVSESGTADQTVKKKKPRPSVEAVSESGTADHPVKKKKKPRPAVDAVGESGTVDQTVKKRKKPRPPVEAVSESETVNQTAKKIKKKENVYKKDGAESPIIRQREISSSVDEESVKKHSASDAVFAHEDTSENSSVAALAYLGVLIILPLFKMSESDFCKAHVRQGMRVFAWDIFVCIVTLAAVLGIRALVLWTLGISAIVYNFFLFVLSVAMIVLVFVPSFKGAVAAFGGEYVRVPFVGCDSKSK